MEAAGSRAEALIQHFRHTDIIVFLLWTGKPPLRLVAYFWST